jgi:transposase-like protein
MGTRQKREVKSPKSFHVAWSMEEKKNKRTGKKKKKEGETTTKTSEIISAARQPESCIYCFSKNTVKRGKRKKKHEVVQLYLCKDCGRTFTPQRIKGKHYPLKVILDGLSFYNIGYTLEDSTRFLKERYGLNVRPATLANWLEEFKDICRYSRIRKFGKKITSPHQTIQGINLYHRQIYKFRIHQAKLIMLLQEDIKHHKFWPLKEFLDATFAECPHHLFKEGLRASEIKTKFNLGQVMIREKTNFATRLAQLLLQAVKENKLRHEALQQFFLCNDSVTVATEVPVYLLPEDIEHMESQLNFKIPVKIERVLTGHIDLIQLRNGAVHILDYKPNAAKERPIEQLTLYALAMSRLTGLRLYDFKCAWFDEKNYFEFFPLHVVYKLKDRQMRVPKNQPSLDILEKTKEK